MLWDSGVLINLGIEQGRWPNAATLLNEQGQIVINGGMSHAYRTFLWQDGVLVPFASAGTATAIADEGFVAGFGIHALLWKFEPAAAED